MTLELLHKIKNKLKRKATTLDCADLEKLQILRRAKKILIFRMSITVLGRGLASMVPASHGKFFLKREPCKQLPTPISRIVQMGSFATLGTYQNCLQT